MQLAESVRHIRQNHPNCIPVLFARHKQADKKLAKPTDSLIIFAKHLKIEQAMYNLYQQIQIKGLFFFVLKADKDGLAKYIQIQPGSTIEQIYQKYGRNQCLTLIYADTHPALIGFGTMEKWMVRILVLLALMWVTLFVYSYYQQDQYIAPPAFYATSTPNTFNSFNDFKQRAQF